MKKSFVLCCFLAMVLLTACTNRYQEIDGEPTADKIQTEAPDITPVVSSSPEAIFQTGENGFSGGNIGQGGLMCSDENGTVYYRSEADEWYLYKADTDGNNKCKICNDVPSDINVLDGWIYYTNYKDGFSIYRIKTDGTEREKLLDGYCQNLFVTGNTVFFDMRDEKNKTHIYRMTTDGKNIEKILEDCKLVYYFKDELYCSDIRTLFKYSLATEQTLELENSQCEYITVDETGVYYWDVDANGFYWMDHMGIEKELIVSNGDFYNYSSGSLYYVQSGGNYDVYFFNVETGEKRRATEFVGYPYDVHGNKIENLSDIADNVYVGNDGITAIYILNGKAFARGTLLEAQISLGRSGCLMALDPAEPWD